MPKINSTKRFSFKKISLAVVLAFVTVGILVGGTFVTFPQIYALVSAKMKFPESKYPGAYQNLVYREINFVKIKGNTKELNFCGVKLKSPGLTLKKDGAHSKQTESAGCVAILDFPGNKRIAITQVNVDYIADFTGETPEETELLKELYGEENLESNYSYVKLVLNTNINEITIFSPKRESISTSVLFILKTIYVAAFNAETGLYNFENERVKGFQFGNPDKTNRVGLQLYKDTNNFEYLILVKGLKQDEIDFMLNSIEVN